MYRGIHLASLLLLAALRPNVFFAYAQPEVHDDDRGLFDFVTRPDIKAPKWNITVYDKEKLNPGYWFFGPYETLNLKDELGNGWIGPHIYDQDGTLVWSGAPLFDNGNVEDFRLSNVNGEELMTVMDQRHARGVLIDQHYKVRASHRANGPGNFNSHEFHFVEDGTKALVVYSHPHEFPRREGLKIGVNGTCKVSCNGINEYDVKSWNTTFQWTSCGHIGIDESTLNGGDLENRCSGWWDYVHANSIDKTPDGDYLLSCRHTDAIYKISHKDGSIVWRLGGMKSDFKHIDGLNFSRQHNIRYRGGNQTHTIVSMLDNAKGIDGQNASSLYSRGLLIALDESSRPMTAQVIKHFDHPDGDGALAWRRGNYQPLPNGNVLMCWSERALQSEHSPDGKMLMQARLQPDWLGTYRSYKFEFVGLPTDPPDVVGKVVDVDGSIVTEVYVSWNGATEVASWKLYKTTRRGKPTVHTATMKKTGFEDKFTYNGYAKFVVVEAIASNGTVLGNSKKIKVPPPSENSTAAVEDEEDWQVYVKSTWYKIRHSPIFIAGVSIAAVVVALVSAYWAMRAARKRGMANKGFINLLGRGRYAPLKDTEKELQDRGEDSAWNPLIGKGRGSEDSEDPFTVADHEEDGEDKPVVVSDQEAREDVGLIRER